MDNELYNSVLCAIKDRSTWESRQDKWYRLRYTGIRRPKKPYPGAPDTHYPLIDTEIEKLKPFYAQQIYSQDRVATFVSEGTQSREMTTMAEQWFDYQLKQRSNFENSMLVAIDTHLNYGLCPVKIYWDSVKKQVAFDPIDPLYVIVPTWTEDIDSIEDWFVHVMRLTVAQYKANPKYKQDIIDQIKGKGTSELRVDASKQQDIMQREGLTMTSDDNQIILWECYSKQDGKWIVETIAPAGGMDAHVRDPFGLPYKHGKLPFVAMRLEVTQKGWYSSRGVAELLEAHEMSLNKNWNSQLQFLDFSGHPVYKNSSLTPLNAQNFQSAPGRILPQGVEPMPLTSAPLDFQQQMQFVRALAEDRVSVPDFGTSENLSGQNQKGGRTATAVNAIVGLSNQSNDLRSRTARLQLGEIYEQAWALLVQYAGEQLQYVFDSELSQLPPEALQDSYTITPSGSADSWNVSQRQAEALGTYQLLFGKPNVNQDELLKWLLENGKYPRLVKRLFQDTGQANQLQGEQQATEIGNMLNSYPMSVKPDNNDDAHIQTLDGFVQRRMQTGEAITPEFGQLVLQHRQGHVNQARSKKNPNAQAYQKQQNQMMQMFQRAMQIASPPPPPTSPGVMAVAEQQAGAAPPQAPAAQPQPVGP